MIYLDNNATTAPALEVFQAMEPYLRENYGNPSSLYPLGQQARHAIEEARYSVAELLGCAISEVVFTSGGTEADNAAICGTLFARPDKRTVVTTAVEHSAVRETLHAWAKRGITVMEVPVNHLGHLDMGRFEDAVREPDVALATVMWANNETGVIFDIAAIALICQKYGVPLHVDAVQVAGKLPMALRDLPLSMASISGHKFHGPKGVGVLYVRRKTLWTPYLTGGPQERDRRGGTENVAGIVGMGCAARIAQERLKLPGSQAQIRTLRDLLEKTIIRTVTDAHVNGDPQNRLNNTSNIGFASLEAEAILLLLAQRDIFASAGAACSSGSLEPSPVLRSMGIPERIAHGSVRFSLSADNTADEMTAVADALVSVIGRLRETLPVR